MQERAWGHCINDRRGPKRGRSCLVGSFCGSLGLSSSDLTAAGQSVGLRANEPVHWAVVPGRFSVGPGRAAPFQGRVRRARDGAGGRRRSAGQGCNEGADAATVAARHVRRRNGGWAHRAGRAQEATSCSIVEPAVEDPGRTKANKTPQTHARTYRPSSTSRSCTPPIEEPAPRARPEPRLGPTNPQPPPAN